MLKDTVRIGIFRFVSPHNYTIDNTVQIKSLFVADDDLIPFICGLNICGLNTNPNREIDGWVSLTTYVMGASVENFLHSSF